MNKKKIAALVVASIFIGTSLWFAGFSYGRGHIALEKAETHQWSLWAEATAAPGEDAHGPEFIQFRHCTNCGLSEFRRVLKVK